MKTYKITVYFNDAELFTTDSNNINNKKTLSQVMGIFKEKFPFKDGFDYQVIEHKLRERNLTLSFVLPK